MKMHAHYSDVGIYATAFPCGVGPDDLTNKCEVFPKDLPQVLGTIYKNRGVLVCIHMTHEECHVKWLLSHPDRIPWVPNPQEINAIFGPFMCGRQGGK